MSKKNPRVLIVTKDAESRGGVANYFNLFFRRFDDPGIRIERFDIGSRSKDYYRRERRLWGYCLDYAWDLCRFVWVFCRQRDIRIVHLNPSLIPVPLLRDGLLLIFAKIFRRKGVVFFRGWRDDVAKAIGRSSWRRWLFCSIFGRADRIIVLAEDFRSQLLRLGIKESKIVVSRTMFDGDLIQPKLERADSITRFLFLSRISREKGAFEIIEAAGKLKRQGRDFSITFHGHGATADTISELKARAEELGVHKLLKWGEFLEGQAKYAAFASADVYLLPSHHEGCPNSVLEAMGAGCYVICTDAGAMKEVVKDGVNGSITAVGDTEDIAEKMRWAIDYGGEVRRLGQANRLYAQKFEAAKIVGQIASLYKSLLQGNHVSRHNETSQDQAGRE